MLTWDDWKRVKELQLDENQSKILTEEQKKIYIEKQRKKLGKFLYDMLKSYVTFVVILLWLITFLGTILLRYHIFVAFVFSFIVAFALPAFLLVKRYCFRQQLQETELYRSSKLHLFKIKKYYKPEFHLRTYYRSLADTSMDEYYGVLEFKELPDVQFKIPLYTYNNYDKYKFVVLYYRADEYYYCQLAEIDDEVDEGNGKDS